MNSDTKSRFLTPLLLRRTVLYIIRNGTHKSKQQHGEDGYFLALSGLDASALLLINGTSSGSHVPSTCLLLPFPSLFAVATRPRRDNNSSRGEKSKNYKKEGFPEN
jgi:hypothetical protein